jgi:hypothetical protein
LPTLPGESSRETQTEELKIFYLLIFKILSIFAQFYEIIFGFRISIFETVMKLPAIHCLNDMGKEAEVVAKSKKGILVDPSLPFIVEIGQNSAVLP